MNNQELANYIDSQIKAGIAIEKIKTALLGAGWKQEVIDSALISINTDSTNQTLSNSVTEKEYPISNRWMWEKSLYFITIILFITLIYSGSKELTLNLVFFSVIYGISLLFLYLSKINFHYSFDNQNVIVRQGILNKKNRTLPFAVIQNVFVKQGLLDRFFGISTLSIENASGGGGAGQFTKAFGFYFKNKGERNDTIGIGIQGNKVSIPGLTVSDAEKLKEIILMKIKENPHADTTSGI
ncbi:hypothetical protein A2627_04775 [Candidatus Woesebacteria bacterium RIFCSPHIGHO2_01_FULL_39_28]|uniref:YdbS-like PH domain-containing protein n=1 Tax=Candidatus Woesebacteria bacterium RIFCSPHIGHO2_01_FULL_39_28 TaxID=1802496 RepID=A0A1F7YA28_9BACT|nr:MAG: hypothetical protein A2627_04775 [Candidatus Woesebacteria bacterium RIFCSPHIGHO2_01_FULL_39_28]OGM58445.1 MAG: hypothetical protein A3A50_01050 [Candidatus Woesebacteria bacterium RIFCSPLOWO2_01_FULL_38_20]